MGQRKNTGLDNCGSGDVAGQEMKLREEQAPEDDLLCEASRDRHKQCKDVLIARRRVSHGRPVERAEIPEQVIIYVDQ